MQLAFYNKSLLKPYSRSCIVYPKRSNPMVRLSKQTRDRQLCPRRNKAPAKKTGPQKDNLKLGYKQHPNALEGELANVCYIPKM